MTLFKATQIVRSETRGCWSVCLYHKGSKRRYWIDLGLDESYHDLEIDWNQYIFYLSDPDDRARKKFQENDDNADEAFSEAVSALESEGEIFQGEDGDWYIKGEEWKGEASWMI